MVRQDIVAGLRNAVERGQSLEDAKETLIYAGYSEDEVEKAALFLTGGFNSTPEKIANFITGNSQEQKEDYDQEDYQEPQRQSPQQRTYQKLPQDPQLPKKSFPWAIVILVFILLLLVSGLVLSIIFRNQLLELLGF